MSPAAAAAPLDDDNLLSEILLRLPPQPSSLPRASLVSKRWLSLVSDTRFLRRFRIHHRPNPPLLGFFDTDIVFAPTQEPPNRVPLPHGRSSLQLDYGHFRLLGCHHGLLLVFLSSASRYQFLVWDPVTGDQHRIAFPSGFDAKVPIAVHGAVLRVAGEVHFQVVVVVADNKDMQTTLMLACVYSSETGAWGVPISTPLPSKLSVNSFPTTVFPNKPAVLIEGSLYWLLFGGSSDILEFNLDTKVLDVIPFPLPENSLDKKQYSMMQADGGGLGFLSLSGFSAKLWKRKTDCNGVPSWVQGRTVEMDELLSLDSEKDRTILLGFAEYNNVVILSTSDNAYMVQLDSLKFKELPGTRAQLSGHHAFESVYAAAGTAIGVDMMGLNLHNM